MAIQKQYGATVTDLAEHFGYDPRTVRAAIRSISDEERHWIGRIAAQELAGLQLALARKAARALLDRDFNRQRIDPKTGLPIPGAFLTSEVQLATVAGIAADRVEKLRVPAGIATDQDHGVGTNPVTALIRNQQELQRVTRGLPAGAKLKLTVSQSLEVSETGSPDGPRITGEAVEASFEAGGESDAG